MGQISFVAILAAAQQAICLERSIYSWNKILLDNKQHISSQHIGIKEEEKTCQNCHKKHAFGKLINDGMFPSNFQQPTIDVLISIVLIVTSSLPPGPSPSLLRRLLVFLYSLLLSFLSFLSRFNCPACDLLPPSWPLAAPPPRRLATASTCPNLRTLAL